MTTKRPTIGKTIKRRGQSYRCVDIGGCENRYGYWVVIYVLRSPCAECGREFETTASFHQIKLATLNRRCKQHAKPGVPVNPTLQQRRASQKRARPTERETRCLPANNGKKPRRHLPTFNKRSAEPT